VAQGAAETGRIRTQWDWILGYALMGVAGAVLLFTWVAVSGSRFVSDQLSSIVSGGLGGLVLLGFGALLIVTAGLSDEWRKLSRLEEALAFPAGEPRTDPATAVRPARIAGSVGLGVSAAFLVPTWYKVSGTADVKPGLGAVTWAVAGLVVGALVAALATMRLQRRVQRRKRQLLGFLEAALPVQPAVVMAARAAGRHPGRVVIAAELTRFHRPGCPATSGLATRAVDPRSLPSSLAPCELCEADAIDREERSWTSVAG
jgi:hypothetical protein